MCARDMFRVNTRGWITKRYSGQFAFYFFSTLSSVRGETARAQSLSKAECTALLRADDPFHTASLLSHPDALSTACEPLKILQYTACSQRAYIAHSTVRNKERKCLLRPLIALHICLVFSLFVSLPSYVFFCPSIHTFCPSAYLSVCLSFYLSVLKKLLYKL